ncbi:hypothetical protein WA026_017580 [Henosepilachna vigintioctopunctata]|uniref:DNA-directed RNA polymerase III subunit n=1 Tax=Henosepilachna vigintioctopunctata TaxID=420089 RepID=A0AAW1UW01_9CUCU
MGGRGRGRGRGGENRSFNREQLNALGVTGNEPIPNQVIEPPPLYRMLERRPVPLESSKEMEYLLLLKQDFIHHMQLSPSYLKMPVTKSNEFEQEIDKLVAQIPTKREKYNWNLFPSELRPKIFAKRTKHKLQKAVDVSEKLNKLEKLEEKSFKSDVKTEPTTNEDDEIIEQEEEQDEEMDFGTDYANNYFDNGEEFDDEDDNLDDGPIY